MYEKDLCEDTRPRKQTKMLELTVKILATFYMSEDKQIQIKFDGQQIFTKGRSR